MRKLIGWILFGIMLGGAATATVLTEGWPRFHRYALTRLDDTTTLDMVKDAKTGVCRLVYRVRETHHGPQSGANVYSEIYPVVAATYLGEVPCDPAPVPPVVTPPVASAVR